MKERLDPHGNVLPSRVYWRSGSYYLVERGGRWRRLGRTFEEAQAELTYLLPSAPGLLRHAMARYQREVLPGKAPRTQLDQAAELARLASAIGHIPADRLSARHVYAYMDQRPPVRANREVALLSHVMSCCIRWGLCDRNVCRDVQRNPERPRDRYVTDAEFAQVYAGASAMMQCAMLLALLTGLRQGDLLKLRREQCEADGLHVRTGKTGRALIYEWSDELATVVERCKALRRRRGVPVLSPWLLHRRDGQPYTAGGFKAIWKRTVAAADCEHFTFHDLRAKYLSDGGVADHYDARATDRVYRRAPLRIRLK